MGCSYKSTENSPETNNNVKPYRMQHFYDEFVKIPVSEVKGLSDIEIATKLFTMYLEHYKAETNPSDLSRLIDYKIEEVREVNNHDETVFSFIYSLHPYAKHSAWVAGNGEPNEDGWILKKILYVRLIKEDDLFTMEIIGTGL